MQNKIEITNNFSKKLLTFFSLLFWLNSNANAQQESDAVLAIEISSAKIKNATFSIKSNDAELEKKIKHNLVLTNRFRYGVSSEENASNSSKNVDLLIVIKSANGFAKVELVDVLQNRTIHAFSIEMINQKESIKEICNQIYSTWLNEPGLFKTAIIFASNITKDLATLSQINYAETNVKTISSPISYLSDLMFMNSKIFITKFCPKKRGFGVYTYDKTRKIFSRVISIQNSSIFSPFVYKNLLYISACANGTTGIYSIPTAYEKKQFANFKEFKEDPQVKIVSRTPGKIATSLSVTEFGTFVCNNYNSTPMIVKMPNTVVSNSSGSYFNSIANGSKIAAIKTSNGAFHLVVINLQTKKEVTLLSKYYIEKPSWSPCGNWIAVSFREKNQKNMIALIHKSGKYTQIIPLESNATNPIWVNQ